MRIAIAMERLGRRDFAESQLVLICHGLVWDMAQWAIRKLGKVRKLNSSRTQDLAIQLANVKGKSSYEVQIMCSCPQAFACAYELEDAYAKELSSIA